MFRRGEDAVVALVVVVSGGDGEAGSQAELEPTLARACELGCERD